MSTACNPTATKTRTRTGCLTCRGRKLKCDEQKPTCGQCRKSKRPCQPADGPFRHEHNASITGTNSGKKRLDKFYKYRQEYANDNYFLPIKTQLRWIHVVDPYAEDDIPPPSAPDIEYQQVAVNGLAVLTSHVDLPGHHDGALTPHPHTHPHHYSLASHSFGHMPNASRPGDVESLLNPEAAGNIDPSLGLPVVSAEVSYTDAQGEEGGNKGLEDIATHAALYAALQESNVGLDANDDMRMKHESDGPGKMNEQIVQPLTP